MQRILLKCLPIAILCLWLCQWPWCPGPEMAMPVATVPGTRNGYAVPALWSVEVIPQLDFLVLQTNVGHIGYKR